MSDRDEANMTSSAGGAAPIGGVYDWYHRALDLLAGGNPDAAAELLAHARASEPESLSVQEALARALFDARRYSDARAAFADITARAPDDDYAQFGLGLALARLQRHEEAAEHLALAVAMRPQRRDYVDALRQVRATVKARAEAAPGHDPSPPDLPGGPLAGPEPAS